MLQNRTQQNLFPSPIKSIGYDQFGILEDIMTLYCPRGFECDPTYSIGNFYKSVIPEPIYKFDINPQVPGVIQASADDLPLENESVNSINFDPPFLASKGPTIDHPSDGQCLIIRRFSQFPTMEELYTFYASSMREFARVLKPHGILVFKCQDTVSGGKNYFSHIKVFEYAIQNGFVGIDLFVLLAKNRIISGKHKNQQHARKYHSYFWVFQKGDHMRNLYQKQKQITVYRLYDPVEKKFCCSGRSLYASNARSVWLGRGGVMNAKKNLPEEVRRRVELKEYTLIEKGGDSFG
jgi:hypothetical protein